MALMSNFNSGVMQVTGTVTATSLVSLMNTASAGKGSAALLQNVDWVILNPEGAIRYTIDGQTPTAAIGLMGATGAQYVIYPSALDKVIIINAQKVNIAMGWGKPT